MSPNNCNVGVLVKKRVFIVKLLNDHFVIQSLYVYKHQVINGIVEKHEKQVNINYGTKNTI